MQHYLLRKLRVMHICYFLLKRCMSIGQTNLLYIGYISYIHEGLYFFSGGCVAADVWSHLYFMKLTVSVIKELACIRDGISTAPIVQKEAAMFMDFLSTT